jgi:hypothetical protein
LVGDGVNVAVFVGVSVGVGVKVGVLVGVLVGVGGTYTTSAIATLKISPDEKTSLVLVKFRSVRSIPPVPGRIESSAQYIFWPATSSAIP